MKNSDMSDYMRLEMWIDRVRETISHWEHIQGITVDDEIKEGIVKFMSGKIKRGIKKGTLMKVFMQIAVTAMLYIKTRRN